ncbi:signal recognition particle-docking protein FtsY [bacterium]|nr:MAG: signal recognition particle-docking protein FtsY [bacterium]
MFGLFKGLKKTKEKFFSPIDRLFKSGRMDQGTLESLEELLILSDIGVETAEGIVESLKEEASGKALEYEDYLQILKSMLRDLMSNVPEYEEPDGRPKVILFVGVNGVGKTSTIGKLAGYYKKQGRSVLLGCCDTFRAAAIEQLELWAERVGVQIVKQKMGSDPAAVAYDSVQAAISRGIDIVLIDTAGRLHTKSNLMEELKKINRVLSEKIEGVSIEVWLVLDANTGQNSLRQAEEFTKVLPVTGLVITKLDSSAKGGFLIPVQRKLNLPVVFVGFGEGVEDIEPFDADDFVSALID